MTVESLSAEFKSTALQKESPSSTSSTRRRRLEVFYVVAPDGLCYWFGERQAGEF